MAGSVNKVILVGNLGRDPEVRPWQPGEVVALEERALMLGLTEKQWPEAMR